MQTVTVRTEYGVVSAKWCKWCKGWQPLGPSNDSPPEVQIEIRAAELCVLAIENGTPAAVLTDGAEYAGWLDHCFDSAKVPDQDGEWAGWLARQIATHNGGGEDE